MMTWSSAYNFSIGSLYMISLIKIRNCLMAKVPRTKFVYKVYGIKIRKGKKKNGRKKKSEQKQGLFRKAESLRKRSSEKPKKKKNLNKNNAFSEKVRKSQKGKKKKLDILCVCLWTEHRAFPNARKDMPKEITGWSHYDVISIFIYNTSLPTQVQRISVIGCLLL